MIRTGSLTPTGEEIRAESMSLQLSERDSTATVTESADQPDRATGAWVRDSAGRVWRIRSVELDPVRKTRTIQLETILRTLQDRIIPAEITGANMGGNANGCTAVQAINKILGYQSDWKLGSCAYSHSEPYQFDGENLMSALETVLDTLEDSWLEISTAFYPFTVNIRKISWEPTCEMRMSRNIQTLKRTIDRSKMYTVFYPVGADDLRIGAVRKNADLYGVREATATDAEMDTDVKLRNWANRMLRRHAQPAVSVGISGMDLSKATGEPLDRLTVGTVCRVPLPEYGTTIAERITRISYSDVIRDPEKVTITMANELADTKSLRSITEAVSASSSSAARGGRSKAKKDKEDNAWFVDTKDKVGMVAQAVAGPGADKNWSRVSELYVDGKGIHGRVTKTENDVVTAYSRIDANEKAIEMEVAGRTKQGEKIRSEIKVEKDRIDATVQAIGKDGKITTSSIVQAINDGKSSINLSADRIALDGTTTINDALTITGGRVYIKKPLRVEGNAMVTSLTLRDGSSSVTISETDLSGTIKQVYVKDGELHLKRVNGTEVTFSKAVTSIDWSRSGGTIYATPQPQGEPRFSYSLSSRVNSVNSLTYMSAPGKGTSSPTTLYYKHSNGAYYELETGYWYMRDNYMAPTTYYA
jgi:hypothetical protein